MLLPKDDPALGQWEVPVKNGLLAVLALIWFVLLANSSFPQSLSVVDIARRESKGRFKFFLSDLVDPSEAQEFTSAIKAARGTVEKYWGNTFEGTFWVEVRPLYRTSMALIPAWRGEHGKMVFPVHRVNQREAAIIHEMVHVYAPNQNRFLAEGLAVYLHHKLGGNPAFPNFGHDLPQLSGALPAGLRLGDLDVISTPRRLELSGQIEEQTAYIVAGSFVGFLVENYGPEKFKQFYALSPLQPMQRVAVNRHERDAQYTGVFTKNLDALEREWLTVFRGNR